MILGFFSLLFDLLFLNFFPYLINTALIFPMFSFVYIVSRLYFNKDIKYTIFLIFLVMSIYGYLFYIIFSLFFFYFIFKEKNKYFRNYYFSIMFFLVFYDFFLVLLNNINILFYLYKLIVTIPINVFYSLFLYKVLNNKKYNIK